MGVYKSGEMYIAQITINGIRNHTGAFKTEHVGTFKTKEEAGVAYDQVAIDKSTEAVSYVLNYPT